MTDAMTVILTRIECEARSLVLVAILPVESNRARAVVVRAAFVRAVRAVLTRVPGNARSLVDLAVFPLNSGGTGAAVIHPFIVAMRAILTRIEGDARSFIDFAIFPLKPRRARAGVVGGALIDTMRGVFARVPANAGPPVALAMDALETGRTLAAGGGFATRYAFSAVLTWILGHARTRSFAQKGFDQCATVILPFSVVSVFHPFLHLHRVDANSAIWLSSRPVSSAQRCTIDPLPAPS